jgi:hypothetical protein
MGKDLLMISAKDISDICMIFTKMGADVMELVAKISVIADNLPQLNDLLRSKSTGESNYCKKIKQI